MKVGVICAVYNSEQYLDECVNSVLKQTFKNYVFVLIDDCSSDNSPFIIYKYAKKDSRFVVLSTPKNSGPGFTKNVGIKYFLQRDDVDFITFVDSDDAISPYYLSELVDAQQKSGANIVVAKYTKEPNCFSKKENIKIINGFDFYANKGKYRYPSNCLVAKLFKKELFIDNLLPKGTLHDDLYIVPKLIMSESKVCLLDDEIYYYRTNPLSIMNQKISKRKIDRTNGLALMADFAIEHKYPCQNHFINCAISANNEFLDKIKANKNQYNDEEYKELVNLFSSSKKELYKKYNKYWTIPKRDKYLYIHNKKNVINKIAYFAIYVCETVFSKSFPKKLMRHLFERIKINNKSAIFMSNPDFADNVYPIYKELTDKGYKCLWVLFKKEQKVKLSKGVKTIVNKRTLFNDFRLARYKYIFYSHSLPEMHFSSKQQIYILWHGSPFKMYRGGLINNTYEDMDVYFVPSSKGCLDIYKKHYPEKIDLDKSLPYRHFRTDYFVDGYGEDEKDNVVKYFNLNRYSNVILCCLTWIRDKQVNAERNNVLGLELTDDELIKINELLIKTNSLLIIKPHPGQKECKMPNLSNIRLVFSDELVDNGLQLYALIAKCTKLITDYSSILFDYCLLDRPTGHIIHNWDYFTNSDKEQFVYDNPEDIMYGTKIYNIDDLIDFIINKKPNNDKLRIEINKLYNDDPYLKESSTKKFTKEVIDK